MANRCEICGKGPSTGRTYTRRGLAKKKGGVGQRITGKTKRTFKPNVQRVRALVGGSVKRIRVCAACLRSGKVTKPVKKD